MAHVAGEITLDFTGDGPPMDGSRTACLPPSRRPVVPSCSRVVRRCCLVGVTAAYDVDRLGLAEFSGASFCL